MCLDRHHTREEKKSVIPSVPFFAYKLVKKSKGKLVSPAYGHKEWKVGVVESSGRNRDNGDSGIYAFAADPGPAVYLKNTTNWKHHEDGQRLLRMLVDPKDIVNSGIDSWGGISGHTIVVKKVTILPEDYENAMDDDFIQAEIDKLKASAQEIKRAAKLSKTKTIEKVKKIIKTAKKKKAVVRAKKPAKKIKNLVKSAKKKIKSSKNKQKTSKSPKLSSQGRAILNAVRKSRRVR